MKYLTKDWYNKMQHTSFHLGLKVNKKAEKYDEVFYEEIYNKTKKRYIKEQSYYADYKKFKKLFLSAIDNAEKLDEEQICAEFEKIKEEIFNGMSIEEAFDFRQNHAIEYLKLELPSNILNKVQDIRVLALDYASSEVYNLLKEYCDSNEKYVEDKFKEYDEVENKQFKDETIGFIEESFHDCFILDTYKDKNDLIIKLNNEYGFTDKTKITFKNYNIIIDEDIKETCWLYNEIYKNKDKYEVHILSSGEYGLKELIVECEDIILK